MYQYTKEAFPRVIGVNFGNNPLPICGDSNQECTETTPEGALADLTEFSFRVPSCANCRTDICYRQQQELPVIS